MSRFLLGILASGLPDPNNQTTHEVINISTNALPEAYRTIILDIQTPAKFHIGMLTISLLIGIAYSGYTAYYCWMEKNIFLGYIRNLVIALTCKTFFYIIFDGVILLGSPINSGGETTLISFVQICMNLVIAFWLTLNIYLHERVQRNFNNEPTLMIYEFGVPGVSLYFALLWIFTLQGQLSHSVLWLLPFTQWIANSINLLYLLIQLALLGNIARAMMKVTLDNDSISLLRKISAMMGVLVLIFWLQFGLGLGYLRSPESHLYFYYLIDGLECALICVVLFFFNKWVLMLLNKVSSLMMGIEGSPRAPEPNEVLLSDGRGIVTVDSVFMTRESGRWKNTEDDGTKDVMYSNVVEPERLKKTLDLYKRLNIIPTTQVTTVEGEEFYDCQIQNSLVPEDSGSTKLPREKFGSFTSNISKSKVLNEEKNVKVNEKKQNRNAFYSSKYLILDSKENDIPKFLETRPSVSTISGRSSFKDERICKNFPSDLNLSMTDELVRKWLDDVSQNTERKEKDTNVSDERKRKTSNAKDSSSKKLKNELILETTENENQTNSQQTVLSTINSAVSSFFFGSNKLERQSLNKEISSVAEEINDTKSLEHDKKEAVNNKIYETRNDSKITAAITSDKKDTITPKEKNEIKIDETEKKQDEHKKELENQEKQVDESQQHQENENKSKDVKVLPSEYPNDSEIQKSEPQHENLPTLTDTEIQQNQMKSTGNEENLKDDSLKSEKPFFKELTKEQPTNDYKDETDTITTDVINNEIQTPNNQNEKLQSLETQKPNDKVTEKTGECENLRQLANDPQDKSELLVLNHSDSPDKGLKNDLLLSDTVEEEQAKPMLTIKNDEECEPKSEPEKVLDKYITYSDLQKFRSQRDQPTGMNKKLFDFSDVLYSTIGSLISVGSSFFTSSKPIPDAEKHTEAMTPKSDSNLVTTNVEVLQNEKTPDRILDKTELEIESKSLDKTELEIESKSLDKTELEIESKSLDKTELEIESKSLDKTELEAESKSLDKTELEIESKSLDKTTNFQNDVKNEPLKSYNEHKLETFTPKIKTDLHFPPHDSFIAQSRPWPELEKHQPTEDNLIEKTHIHPYPVYEQQSAIFPIDEKNWIKKTQKPIQKPKSTEKKIQRKLNNEFIHKKETFLPFKDDEQCQDDVLRKQLQKTVTSIPAKESNVTETSSDSEFSIEKRKDSSSSAGSFSVDKYYANLVKCNEKFYNQSNSVQNPQKKLKTH